MPHLVCAKGPKRGWGVAHQATRVKLAMSEFPQALFARTVERRVPGVGGAREGRREGSQGATSEVLPNVEGGGGGEERM